MLEARPQWLIAIVMIVALTGCNAVLFHPDSNVYATPKDFNVSYHAATFQSLDGTQLSGWWMEPEGVPKGTLLVAHGNAENISSHFAGFAWLVHAGYEVFIFDYRGFGRSAGEADLEGAVQDTETALAYVLGERPGCITVIGQSIGGALLFNALARRGTGRIALAVFDSTFASLPQAGSDTLSRSVLTWPFQWGASLALTDAYDPIELAPTLDVPKLYIAGSSDAIISPNQSWQLFDASSRPRMFWLVKDAGHINAFSFPKVQERFLAFLRHPVFDPDASAMLIFDTISP